MVFLILAPSTSPLSSRSRFFIRGDDAWEIYDNEIVESVANDIKAAVETLNNRPTIVFETEDDELMITTADISNL
jgi:hypothetical protein